MLCTFALASELNPCRRSRDHVQVLERTQVEQIEHRPEVDMERVGPLAGEERAVADAMHTLRSEVLVVRGRARADVARRHGQVRSELHSLAASRRARDAVVLATVEVRVEDRGDLTGVVEERLLVEHDGVEAEAVGDVGLRVAAVGDVNLVENVVAELEEVRAAVRRLRRERSWR